MERGDVVAEHRNIKRHDPMTTRQLCQVAQKPAAKAASLPGVGDHHGNLGMAASRPVVARQTDDSMVGLSDEGDLLIAVEGP